MSKMKKILSLILVIAVVLSMCAALSACKKENGSDETGSGEAGNYTVTVKSAGGMPLEGVAVSVYADDSLSDLKGYDETDENGAASIELDGSSNYAITLSGAPKGYAVEDFYRFEGTKAEIALTSSLITGESLGDTTLKLGDVMYDFTVTTPDGTKVILSEMLKEKKMVLLNFWYTGCSWCVTEFPFMEQAYQQYIDDVGIVAVDPLGETDAAIAAFPTNYNLSLSFPLAACPTTWSNTFGITGYPTSVIIDRYGVICLIEAGAITSLTPFTSLFETMTADDYQQKLYGSVSELVVNPKPTFTMDTPENVAALLNSGEIPVTYHAEDDEDSKEYAWPFIEAEKLGEKCLKASNQGIDSSFGVIYADVELKAGQALGLDYLMSSESGSDTFVVIVDGQDIFTISGMNDPEKWESCYPVVADKDGTYEVALFYLKDESTGAGDDTVYIKNVRIVSVDDIDTATYLPREAATSEDGFAYNYVDLVFNSKDGYYHVGSENGPLLLADLMGYTQFNEETSIWELAYNGKIVVEGKDYLEQLEQYCNYASNAKGGICTVNQELYELLQMVDKAAGFDEADDKEWMKACKYFQAYGTAGGQLEDPIKGLATFSAYTAKEGKNVSSNYFYYDRIIMPRGLLAEFVPSKSGVYRITSRTDSTNGVEGWIFDETRTELLVYEQDERLFNDSSEVSMVFYMEKGKSYFIDIAFWDPYEVGTIYYDIEFVANKLDHFRLCAPGYFTYDTNATGDAMYHLITGGIKAVLGDDGIYYEDLGDGKKGSKIYADFTGLTSVFSAPIATVDAYNEDGSVKKDENGNPVKVKGMIELGGFDFSKNENDLYILSYMAKNDNDVEKTKAALKEEWGESYDTYAAEYQIEDVFAGKYHGKGEDLTEEITTYLDDIITSGPEELRGCVVVTERLAEILHLLMDKYTFEDVDQSWLKVCYYYDYLGA
ncbi:MAG: redoxin domain-containing protein [Oscillospiraceae bacterium]|nr:redoxin domain-containing protein [Oscillospiraceae bacterium]